MMFITSQALVIKSKEYLASVFRKPRFNIGLLWKGLEVYLLIQHGQDSRVLHLRSSYDKDRDSEPWKTVPCSHNDINNNN